MFMFLFFYVKIFFSIDDEEENPCSISTWLRVKHKLVESVEEIFIKLY
jgi:hypothetical protein